MGVYVQIEIAAELDEVWEYTQNPAMHRRWDLRFTKIDYIPKLNETAPQEFSYETRLGFGVTIAGVGTSIANRTSAGGVRTSSLKFSSSDRRSLILDGAGYWKYEPMPLGTWFTTGYDYSTRFGELGRLLDKAVFRPLIGWATAWSFDSLRLWITEGQPPEQTLERAAIHGVARISLATLWIYQGLVPKLLNRNSLDFIMTVQSGVPRAYAASVITGVAWLEILFGLAILVFWRNWRLLALQVPLLLLLMILTLITSPAVYADAFNPLSTNLPMIALAAIGWYAGRQLPSARNCRRSPEKGS